MSDNVSVSIVIRTKNEARGIARVLHLIRSQSLAVEIIVVDSGSSDGTVEILHREEKLQLIEIEPSQFSFGRALNFGFEVARGDIVVSLSAHAFPCHTQWLAALLKHFDDPTVAGVYGRQFPQIDAWPPVKRDYLEGLYGDELRVQQNGDSPADHFFSNANAAIRRKCWKEYPFDEFLPYCEDRDWARNMLKTGYKIVYEPEASVYHSHNESLMVVHRRNYSEARALQLLYGSGTLSWHAAFKKWIEAVRGDVRFILENGEKATWLPWTAVYRLFWTLGWLRPQKRNS